MSKDWKVGKPEDEMDIDDRLWVIQQIRSDNNRRWMSILEISIKRAPVETREIIAKIKENDEEISKWLDKL